MAIEEILDHRHPLCGTVRELAVDLEECLSIIHIPDPPSPNEQRSKAPSLRELVDGEKEKATFSDWFGLSGAVYVRNRASHSKRPNEPPLTLVEVKRAKASFEDALRDLVADSRLPPTAER